MKKTVDVEKLVAWAEANGGNEEGSGPANQTQTYSFVVATREALDFKRIFDEMPEDAVGVVITVQNCEGAVLLLRSQWVCSFDRADEIYVGRGGALRHGWGTNYRYTPWLTGNNVFECRAAITNTPWAFDIFPAADLEEVRSQIAAAKAFKRRIEVTVVTVQSL